MQCASCTVTVEQPRTQLPNLFKKIEKAWEQGYPVEHPGKGKVYCERILCTVGSLSRLTSDDITLQF